MTILHEISSLSCRALTDAMYSLIPNKTAQLSVSDLRFFAPLDSLEVFEFLDLYLLYYSPQRDDVIFDLGSHVGFFTIPVAKIVGEKGLVVSVEPNPHNFNLLMNNIIVNNCKNVIPIQAAVWFKRDIKRLYSPSSISASLFQRGRECKKFYDVNTVTMSALIDLTRVKRINFMKVDIEGSEIHVLTEIIIGSKL